MVIKITAVDSNGNYVNDISINIDEAKVYNLPLDKIFNNPKINNYLIEFLLQKSLFYPAVMINYIGKNFVVLCTLIIEF